MVIADEVESKSTFPKSCVAPELIGDPAMLTSKV
jgi:hypothetical protein